MPVSLFGDNRIDVLQQALTGLSRRQQAIAGNIANVDTPGYKRQDVNFEAGLQAQMSAGNAQSLQTTDPRHFATVSTHSSSMLKGALGTDASHSRTGRNDENNVDIDYEMSQLAETSLRYEMLTQATSNRFNTLKEIVTKVA